MSIRNKNREVALNSKRNGSIPQSVTEYRSFEATETWVENRINATSAYYLTYNADGDAFPTYSDLVNASVYYSGGKPRTPTRNDYAIVEADETHEGTRWRYIYGEAEDDSSETSESGEPSTPWEPQYPITTGDYEALNNKPSINGTTMSGDVMLTGADIPLDGGDSSESEEQAETVAEAISKLDAEIGGKLDDAPGSVGTDNLAASSVTNAKLAANAVTNAKLAANSVTSAKIAAYAVTNEKIANLSINDDKLQDNSITTAKIRDGVVTEQKLSDDVQSSIDDKRDKTDLAVYERREGADRWDVVDGTGATTALPLTSTSGISATYSNGNAYGCYRLVTYDYRQAGGTDFLVTVFRNTGITSVQWAKVIVSPERSTEEITETEASAQGLRFVHVREEERLFPTEDTLAKVSQIPAVVAPSTSASDSGKAADAKATGDALAGKQDALTFDTTPMAGSQNPVTSEGIKNAIDAATPGDYAQVKAQVQTNTGDIADIKAVVPSAATARNPLVDTQTMNSSIATNTANFLGTYSYVTDLGFPQPSSAADVNNAAIATALGGLTFAQTPTNNDYVFVSINYAPTTDVDEFRRFKFNGTEGTWAYEYTLNNSSFTAAQWAAINSGITSGAVEKLAGIAAGAQVNVIETVKVNGTALTPDGQKAVDILLPAFRLEGAVMRTSPDGVKSSGIWSAIWGALSALPTGFSSLYDWVVAQLAGKANNADVVHKTGDETIAGEKTFTGGITIYGTNSVMSQIYFPSGEHGAIRFGSELFTVDDDTETVKIKGKNAATTAPNPTAGNLAALDADGNPTDSGVAKSDVESLLFARYYPDGSVKSAAEFTSNIKYDAPDTTHRTITVQPFCNTGTASDDNSSLVGRVVIPPFVDAQGNGYITDDGMRYKVVGVSGGSAMDVNNNLTAIIAPTTVTSIGDEAFYGCSALTSVSLPSATSIGNDAFYDCASLTSVSLPSATSIGDEAFYYCTSLASVSLPSATSIGDEAFYGCSALTSVSLPSATSIRGYAFYDCTSLASVSLPSATSIGDNAFYGCTSLASVSLPSATSIGDNAFYGCTSLKSVSLPAAKESIPLWAFYDCTLLASVDFGNTPRTTIPTLNTDAFSGVPEVCKIIVPYTQYDAWIAADGWKDLPQEFVRHAEKADKPATFTTGNLAKFDSDGNPTDSGKKPSDFQTALSSEQIANIAAVPNKANKADATLTEKWTPTFALTDAQKEAFSSEPGASDNDYALTIVPPTSGESYTLYVGSYNAAALRKDPSNITNLILTGGDARLGLQTGDIVATLSGYQLGSQEGKHLASEAEAEALRQGKQDALTAQQLANIAAVSDALAFDATHSYAAGDPVVYNGTLYTFTAAHTGAWTGSDVSAVDIIARLAGKLDKSGGTMTGSLSAPQVNITRDGYPTWSMELDNEVGSFHFRVPPLAGVLGSVDLTLPRRTDNLSGTVALAASPSTAGNLAALDVNGNPTDSGIKPSDKANTRAFAQNWEVRDWYEWMEGDWAWYNDLLYRATRDLEDDIDPDVDPDAPGEADKHKPGVTDAWERMDLNDVQTIGGMHRAESFVAVDGAREIIHDADGLACQEKGYGGIYFPRKDGMPRVVVSDEDYNERTYRFAPGHVDGEEVTVAISADIPYSLVTKTISNNAVTLDDRAVNLIVQETGQTNIVIGFPAETQGKVRDFALYFDCSEFPPVIQWNTYAEFLGEATTSLDPEEGMNVYAFTEISRNKFYVSHKLLTSLGNNAPADAESLIAAMNSLGYDTSGMTTPDDIREALGLPDTATLEDCVRAIIN